MTDERVLEIRTYRLLPGRLEEFGRRVAAVIPMLERHGVEVVGHGPSIVPDEGDHYVLARAFGSLAERDVQEAAFYGGDEWREGPRDGILEFIETYHTVVLRATDDAIRALAATLR